LELSTTAGKVVQVMAWDFSTEPEFQKKLEWVEELCKNEIEPLGFVFPYAVRARHPKVRALVKGIQDQIKAQGLWAIFLDKDLGGPGYGQLKLGLLNEVIGRYPSAPQMFGAAAPDTGNMEMLAAYGTEEQKERWLKPMLNQQLWSAYSMTEPQGGSDPKLFKTHAVRDGDEWVINGEKWFTSAGRAANLLFVMCTNGMFVVPRETQGVEFMPEPRAHNHIKYNNVRVPADHLLGPEGDARTLAQRRLGGGRIHHAMRTLARCKLAFDMMCERALSRQSHGQVIAEHQMVQEKIADSYAAIKMLRLFVLETAWKIDNSSTADARTDIAAVKYTMAKVLREVSFNALHIHGSLGTTDLTPLQAMYAGAPTMGIADGVDEVHKVTVARNVLKSYQPHEGLWPTEYIPAKRDKARQKFEPMFAKDPELRAVADGYAKYARGRGSAD
jgi:acyl-CoA dehydrogenase